MEALREPLSNGIMVDNYGLEEPNSPRPETAVMTGKRPPTRVSFQKAIFILTAEVGSEWYQHPDLRHALEREDSAANTIREAMLDATQIYRGEERIMLFDRTVLKEISEHLVLLRPLSFPLLLGAAVSNLEGAKTAFASRFSCRLVVDEPELLGQVHLLSVGANRGLAATTVQSLEQNLLGRLTTWMISNNAAVQTVRVGLSRTAKCQLAKILKELAEEPMESLRRKRRNLRFKVRMTRTTANVGEVRAIFSDLLLEKALSLADYSGALVHLTATIPDIKFSDVAGHQPAKAFFREMIDYLKHPEEIRKLGIELPRGALLYGPPGTGKTMLAQSFAGEADLPFIAVAAADLLHSDRITELYRLARRNAPCVIFLDEADSLGTRGTTSGTHDAAINRLLTEIQGFSSTAPIFHLLATNREEVLDPALVRAGRIDRRFYVGPLDRKARAGMIDKLLVMANLDSDEHQEMLLSYSQGMTGSELQQVRRECGLHLLRSRDTHHKLGVEQLMEEITNTRFGDKANGIQRLPEFRRRVAVHEIGHGLIHAILFPELPLNLITISPRESGVQGFISLDSEGPEQFGATATFAKKQLCVLMGGRVAEQIEMGEEGRSSGAANDLARATALAFQAIARAGMDEEFGLISLAGFQQGADIPPSLSQKAWERVASWLKEAEEKSFALLRSKWPVALELVNLLLDKEYLNGSQVAEIINRGAK
jgi:cell division protease FtsH